MFNVAIDLCNRFGFVMLNSFSLSLFFLIGCAIFDVFLLSRFKVGVRQRFLYTLVWFVHRLIDEQLGVGAVIIIFFSLRDVEHVFVAMVLQHIATIRNLMIKCEINNIFYECSSFVECLLQSKEKKPK